MSRTTVAVGDFQDGRAGRANCGDEVDEDVKKHHQAARKRQTESTRRTSLTNCGLFKPAAIIT